VRLSPRADKGGRQIRAADVARIGATQRHGRRDQTACSVRWRPVASKRPDCRSPHDRRRRRDARISVELEREHQRHAAGATWRGTRQPAAASSPSPGSRLQGATPATAQQQSSSAAVAGQLLRHELGRQHPGLGRIRSRGSKRPPLVGETAMARARRVRRLSAGRSAAETRRTRCGSHAGTSTRAKSLEPRGAATAPASLVTASGERPVPWWVGLGHAGSSRCR
jgi:hypothetical protein